MKKLSLFLLFILSACQNNLVENTIPLPKIITPTEMYPTLTPTINDPLSGMIIDLHSLKGAIINIWNSPFLINKEGELNRLWGRVDKGFDISNNGQEYVYSDFGQGSEFTNPVYDIFYCDTQKYCKNITNTPNQSEMYPKIWKFENIIIFASCEKPCFSLSDGPFNMYQMNKNGENRKLLWEIENVFLMKYSLSPKGQDIAIGYKPAIRSYGNKFVNINPEDYGIQNVSLFDPVWSPNGKEIAWEYYENGYNYEEDEFNYGGVVIVNLETQTSRIITKYKYKPWELFDGGLTWSPDGKWLAVITDNELLPENSEYHSVLKIINVETGRINNIINASGPLVWSTNGYWLTFIDKSYDTTTWPSIIELETSRISKILNERFEVIGWINNE